MPRVKEFSNELIAALPATGKRYEVKDPLCPGLRVIVQPSGAKSFAVRYSHDGQYKKLTLGSWPQIRLTETAEAKRERLSHDPTSQAPDAGVSTAWRLRSRQLESTQPRKRRSDELRRPMIPSATWSRFSGKSTSIVLG